MKAFTDPESQKTLVIMNLRHDLESLKFGIPQTDYAMTLAVRNFLEAYRDGGIIQFENQDLEDIVKELVNTLKGIYGSHC